MLDDPDCAAWFECFNVTQHEAGDHLIPYRIGHIVFGEFPQRCGAAVGAQDGDLVAVGPEDQVDAHLVQHLFAVFHHLVAPVGRIQLLTQYVG